MVKIVQNSEGGKIIWGEEDFPKGLLPSYATTTAQIRRGNELLSSSRAFNPFRNYGYAYPGYLASDVINVSEITEYCRKGLVNGTTAYIVTNGLKLQALDLTTDTLTTSFHTISPPGGSAPASNNTDCVIYTAKVGGTSASRYFYSYSSTTIWDVGTFDFASTFDDDFMSTAPATPLASPYTTGGHGYPHPLIVGDDDVLYMGDRNFLHAYDGQDATDNDGKFFPAVLTLPGGWIINSFVKTDTGLMIFTYFDNPTAGSGGTFYQGKTRAWKWDYNNLDITNSYDLNDYYVTESFIYEGAIGCFTQGTLSDPATGTKTSKMQIFDGTKFKVLVPFVNNIPIRGGVDIQGDALVWNAGGTVYSYGSPLIGVKSGLNTLTEGLGSISAMLSNFKSGNQYISSGITTSGGLQNLSTNYNANASYSSPLAEPIFPERKIGHVTNVKIRYSDITTSAVSRSLTIQLRDRSPNSSTIVSNITDIPDANAMVADFNNNTSNIELLKFDALKLVLQWGIGNGVADAPGISGVEVTYKNINLGA